MQPYFFPYLGYFSLIAATDHFVVFDPVQYIRHGWINRNRILKPGFDTDQYINIPLAKHSRNTLIKDIRISKNIDWKSRILGQLQHYQQRAPYFRQAKQLIEKCLEIDTDNIVELNVHCLKTICESLDFRFNYTCFDEINREIKPASHPGEWALHIATALGATEYINPEGGRDIFRPEQFGAENVKLSFLKPKLYSYSQRNRQFIPGLSIIDVLMFNSLEETKRQINQHTIETISS